MSLVASAPGVGPITSRTILGRLGHPARFTSLTAVRAYSGLVPSLNASGTSVHRHADDYRPVR